MYTDFTVINNAIKGLTLPNTEASADIVMADLSLSINWCADYINLKYVYDYLYKLLRTKCVLLDIV